ncbi:DNA repair protein rad5 [Penicillium cosmopolitanum]|uniref:DNA repair protein rad5 n=1 Tax=Penicillium cosmopolitanum TaxID=1131564 RepID=A0A9W9W9R0_9EURO|nr:DNA repair protein rad5 [Penicillium cosmopolitanum]KAJ5408818.1 DNA repair protein rad5 [Penicillium cosmopolitanum]
MARLPNFRLTSSSIHGFNAAITSTITMSGDLDQPPLKKQRFFTEDPSAPQASSSPTRDASFPRHCPDIENSDPEHNDQQRIPETPTRDPLNRSDRETAAPIDSPVTIKTTEASPAPNETIKADSDSPYESIKAIQTAALSNVERAVNIYFDGSWKKPAKSASITNDGLKSKTIRASLPLQQNSAGESSGSLPSTKDNDIYDPSPVLRKQPATRYIGAFGVGGWATRSGLALLKHGDPVNIERARSQPVTKRARNGKMIVNQKGDVLTRFTNTQGQEIGRLPHETAEWVSTLLDQKICYFEAVCVYMPERVRVNDTVYLQLRCFLRKEAFQHGLFVNTSDDNRAVSMFEEKESTEEKNLRLRQVSLVKLFHEINLQPTSINPTTEKHKREGLLQAAEMAEKYDGVKKEKAKTNKDDDESSSEDETQELEEDQLDSLYRKAQSFDFNMPEAEPGPDFVLDLRKYQKQALHWMLSKEKDKQEGRDRSMHPLWEEYIWPTKDVDDKNLPQVEGIDHFYVNPYSGDLSVDFPAQEQRCLGGVLADEMGLGKTIEMLSLVHTNKTEPRTETSNGITSVNDLARVPNSSTAVVPAPYTTLVVAPTSLLAQWESEALKASTPGSMRVLMYYGTEKAASLRDICCEAKHASAPHVIVTSYGVVLSEFRQLGLQSTMAAGAHNGLFSVTFFRVILDEAHLIKNRRSKSARACYELKSLHRWVLTGTPIVNRLEDLFSLVRFLKVEPWSNFSFWKTFITVPFESKEYVRALNVVQSVLEPLVLRRTKTMKTPEGEPLVPLPRRVINIEEVELSQQEREIYDCIYTRARRTYNENVAAGTLMSSYSTIFAQILRLRQTCCHPILTRKRDIVADEETLAAALDATSELKDDMDLQELINQFSTSTENAETENAEAEDRSMKTFTAHALRQIQTDSSGECPICCEDEMIEPAVTACWHSACKKCLQDFIRHQMNKGEQARCFSCRVPIDAKDIFEVVKHPAIPMEKFPWDRDVPSITEPAPRISLRRINPLSPSAHTSAKIHALISHLGRIPPNTKSIVVSQFTSFLDLIGDQLSRVGVSHLRLDGSMHQKARAAVLAEFTKTDTYVDEIIDTEDDTPTNKRASSSKMKPSSPPATVLLLSLKAGGVGLNLTVASNVFMMDPWWSFAIEAQAIDRVHRMGQTRDVAVTRFVVKDSIEGRILSVQERKMNIAGTLGLRVGGDDAEDDKKKDKLADLKLLFE